jgi:uncharacterized protein (TIGR03435 family)
MRRRASVTGYQQPAADATRRAESASEPTGVYLIALVQKLGLRLAPQRAPIETIVVDHLERVPTAN